MRHPDRACLRNPAIWLVLKNAARLRAYKVRHRAPARPAAHRRNPSWARPAGGYEAGPEQKPRPEHIAPAALRCRKGDPPEPHEELIGNTGSSAARYSGRPAREHNADGAGSLARLTWASSMTASVLPIGCAFAGRRQKIPPAQPTNMMPTCLASDTFLFVRSSAGGPWTCDRRDRRRCRPAASPNQVTA